MNWKPKLFPAYRPPRQGWQIREMPEGVPDVVRKAWVNRQNRNGNRNAAEAVAEMATFLRFNKLVVTNDVQRAIQEQADAEWCAAEPDRCPRQAGSRIALAAVKKGAAEKVKFAITNVQRVGGGVVLKRKRGCCGG